MPVSKDSFDTIFRSKSNVLMVFAHPDDMEINCGGLAARLVRSGITVRLVCMTAGEAGVRARTTDIEEFKAERLSALGEAAAELGLNESEVFCLDIPDGYVEDSMENIGRVVWHIRSFRPEVVITHNPSGMVHTVDRSYFYVNHRDHRNTGRVTVDAVYPYSRDHAFFPDHIDRGLKGHWVHEILFGDAFEEDGAVNFEVSAEKHQKKAALRRHMEAHAMDLDEFNSYSNEGTVGNQMFETLGWWTQIH